MPSRAIIANVPVRSYHAMGRFWRCPMVGMVCEGKNPIYIEDFPHLQPVLEKSAKMRFHRKCISLIRAWYIDLPCRFSSITVFPTSSKFASKSEFQIFLNLKLGFYCTQIFYCKYFNPTRIPNTFIDGLGIHFGKESGLWIEHFVCTCRIVFAANIKW